jgi:hypothetical protein
MRKAVTTITDDYNSKKCRSSPPLRSARSFVVSVSDPPCTSLQTWALPIPARRHGGWLAARYLELLCNLIFTFIISVLFVYLSVILPCVNMTGHLITMAVMAAVTPLLEYEGSTANSVDALRSASNIMRASAIVVLK